MSVYRLTPRMLQRLERDLRKYHELFSGGRCAGWQQEELVVAAIKSDTAAQHHVFWQEAGHDDKADIRVRTNGDEHFLQLKSGKVQAESLILSGHRLGRFGGVLKDITDYLNSGSANLLAIPYKRVDDENGRRHIYQVSYVDAELLTGLSADDWKREGKSYEQVNEYGVEFSVRPSMSWQVWWSIPLSHVEQEEPFIVC